MPNKFSSNVEVSSKDINYKNDSFYLKNKYNKNGLLVVYAPWCGYCQMLAPTWKKFAKEYSDKFLIKALNIEGDPSNKRVSEKMGVEGFPTILYVDKDGKIEGKYEKDRNIKEFVKYLSEK